MPDKPKNFPGRTTAGNADNSDPTAEQIAHWMSHPREAQGRLQHHDQPCDECKGTGFDLDDSEDEEIAAEDRRLCFHSCENGVHRWGSWYVDDKTECAKCGEDKPVGHMFHSDGAAGHCIEYVCFTCYVTLHKEWCGCAMFQWAEKALGIEKENDDGH